MKKFLSQKILGKTTYTKSTSQEFKMVSKKLKMAIEQNGFNIVHTHDMKKVFLRRI